MELSYIFAAIRRRLWLLVVFACIGLVGGYAARQSGASSTYEARAVLLVSPPESATGGTVFLNDPDRYVIGQVSVLNSIGLAAEVANQNPGETAQSVAEVILIEHEPKTDIVRVIGRADDPQRATRLANAYASQYISDLRARASSAQAPGIDKIDSELKLVADRLNVLEDQIRQRPTDSAAVAEREQRLRYYTELLANRSQLELAAITRVTSEVVESATVPTVPVSNPGNLFVALGVAGGLLLGVVASVVVARSSPYILDRYQIENALDLPVAGDLPHLRTLATSPAGGLNTLPTHAEHVVTRLCSRAEANVSDEKALIVAVVGTQRRAGATTTAITMAGRFARTDNNVVLVDFDQQEPELTDIFGGHSDGGIPALVSYLGQGPVDETRPFSQDRSRRVDITTIFTSTSNKRVRVLGVGSDPDAQAVRRSEISRILDHVSSDVNVIVVDAGSLLDAAAAEQVVRLADCVVLTMPARRLKSATLESNSRLLNGRYELLLPVITHPSRRRSRHGHRPVSATPAS